MMMMPGTPLQLRQSQLQHGPLRTGLMPPVKNPLTVQFGNQNPPPESSDTFENETSAQNPPAAPATRVVAETCNSRTWQRSGWVGALFISLMGPLGYSIYQGNSAHRSYENQPVYQTHLALTHSLGRNMDTIPALTDPHHTSSVVRNQLLAHLNAVALFNLEAGERGNTGEWAELSRAQKSLIHDLDHMRLTVDDQRAVGRMVSALEHFANEAVSESTAMSESNQEAKTKPRFLDVLQAQHEKYADEVLAKHFSAPKVDLYKTLSAQYIEQLSHQGEGEWVKLLLIFGMLGGTGLSTSRLLTLAMSDRRKTVATPDAPPETPSEPNLDPPQT